MILFLASVFVLVPFGVACGQMPLPSNLVDLRSDRGEELLVEAEARKDYFSLASHFDTQESRSSCGVASMTMVLNAMEVTAPEVPELAPYRTFTQANVLDERTEEVVPLRRIRTEGMSLDQLAAVLATKPVTVSVHHAGTSTLGEFREQAQDCLARSDHFVIVNYFRPTLGQEGGGHHSPLAAYHRKSDRFLILDVARYKYPPVWVPASELFDAMNTTVPGTANKTRGYLLVSRK
jgi:Phytochelatin synthase